MKGKSAKNWVLIGHWEGMPYPIEKYDYVPPFSIWVRTSKKHFYELREEGYYTRLSHTRPKEFVDAEFQKGTSTLWPK